MNGLSVIKNLGEIPQGNLFSQVPDMTMVVHPREKGINNQRHLENNRFHFTGQVAFVIEWLQKGVAITSLFAAQNGITRLASRINDAGEFGNIDIDREYTIGKDGKQTRFLAYFLPHNRAKFIAEGNIMDKKRWWYSDIYTPKEIIQQIKETR